MPRKSILALLTGGDRRSIGHADQVVAAVCKTPSLFSQLISGLRSQDPLVRMRAADSAEKISRTDPALLEPHKDELLVLMAETGEQELRWHLAVMVPRLPLSSRERQHAVSLLHGYLNADSSIVKIFALQGIADFARQDPAIRQTALKALRNAARNGTPAMKARSRKLQRQLKQR